MIPSAAPYSVTWNTERQVTTESPLNRGLFFVRNMAKNRDLNFF
jgi:hypothetical protein